MSNPQSHIPGRTPLSDAQKAAIQQLDAQHSAHMQLLDGLKANSGVDQRALAIAITNAQTAHMWAVRSVAKPAF